MLSRWITGRKKPDTPFAPIAPDRPFIAIGDIHGRADLLEKGLSRMPACQIVCVGDYVDRGDRSDDVLRLLQSRADIICLSGNHEEMMLDFLERPREAGPRWLRNGGLQTLASFGISGATEGSTGAELAEIGKDLKSALGADLIAWLKACPTSWQSGNVAVVHAGADPHKPISEQATETLHWGHAEFARTERRDGIWVLHGHTIVDEPLADRGRIAIDTGAYATGRLTAALVTDEGVEFETV